MVTINPHNIGSLTASFTMPPLGSPGITPLLTANGKVLLWSDGDRIQGGNLADKDYVDDAVAGASGRYLGNWNASTNSPAITVGVGNGGDTYTVSVAGTQSITGSPIAFAVGDQVRFSSVTNSWSRVPNVQAVTSVNDQTGSVVIEPVPDLTLSVNGNLYVAAFGDDLNFNGSRPAGIYVSSDDGKTWRILTEFNFDVDGTVYKLGDPSLYYKDGWFYCAFTNSKVNEWDTLVGRSRTLLPNDWEMVKCKLGSTLVKTSGAAAPGWTYSFADGPRIWAPEWFEDTDGKLYLFTSISCAMTGESLTGANPELFRTFVSECTSLEDMTFTAPVELRMNGRKGVSEVLNTEGMIDASVIRHPDGRYIMVIKHDYDMTLNTYSATSLTGNFSLIASNIMPIAHYPGRLDHTEAPCIVPFYRDGDLLWFILGDRNQTDNTYRNETTDFLFYTDPVSIEADSFTRHGTVINLGLLPEAEYLAAAGKVARLNAFAAVRQIAGITAQYDLVDHPGYPNIPKLKVQNGTLYFASNTTILGGGSVAKEIVISGIDGDADIPEGACWWLQVNYSNYYANGEPVRIKFPAGCTNLYDNAQTTWFGQHVGTGSALIKFVKYNGSWKVESVGGADVGNGRSGVRLDLGSITDAPNINAAVDPDTERLRFWPISNAVYVTRESSAYDAPIVINSLPTDYPPGKSFFFQCLATSDPRGKITLKAGAHAAWPADVTIGSESVGRLIEVRFQDGKWALVGRGYGGDFLPTVKGERLGGPARPWGRLYAQDMVRLNAAAGTARSLSIQTDDVTVWELVFTTTDDLELRRYVSGALAGTPIRIARTTGIIRLYDLPVFADNTAAAAHPTNGLYRTSTGQMMVKY
ncbi:hypothetical protein PMI04_009710 [Sphingobium sp. AP49]|uniref:hypothetical protein n=1 Tax=Sphingobium sp. AP49 TaxID=1144307 RepID=UPI00026EC882|nr:hypothetical protein [Sphingobium sp. AP49]WHO40836.1 hypothetical protein PMI04_009710 [Sphingobium sp. AP49]